MIKVILKKPFLTPSKELYSSRFMSLQSLIKLEQCKYMFKIKNGFTKYNFDLKLNNEVHNYNTRSVTNINITNTKNKLVHNNLLKTIINEYNQIPTKLKTIKNANKFKNNYKIYIKHLLQNNNYN